MSKTMSNPNDWSHFYNHHHHQNFSSSTAAASGGSGASTGHSLLSSSDAIFATTTTTTATASADASNNPIQFIGSSRNSSTSSLNPEGGRVSKPARKRSRASRRTPTTLLNTDTSNFRAMVQQFTGGPVGPFGTSVGRGSSSLNLPGFTYGLLNNNSPVPGRQQQLATHQLIGNQIPNAAMSTADGSGGGGGGFQHLQQYQPQFQSPSPFLFSLGNNNSISDGGPTNSNTASDNPHLLLLPGEASAGDQTGGAPPSGTNENRGSGFLY